MGVLMTIKVYSSRNNLYLLQRPALGKWARKEISMNTIINITFVIFAVSAIIAMVMAAVVVGNTHHSGNIRRGFGIALSVAVLVAAMSGLFIVNAPRLLSSVSWGQVAPEAYNKGFGVGYANGMADAEAESDKEDKEENKEDVENWLSNSSFEVVVDGDIATIKIVDGDGNLWVATANTSEAIPYKEVN